MSGLLRVRGPPCSRVTAFGAGAGAVWLGRGAAAQDRGLLAELGVTHILNVADDVPNFHAGDPALTYCALEVGDFGADAGISRVFATAHAFARSACAGAEIRNNDANVYLINLLIDCMTTPFYQFDVLIGS